MGTEGIQDKYVNPYTDFGFKLLLGTVMNKELLLSFLNALLFGEETVKDVTYLNTEHLGTQEYGSGLLQAQLARRQSLPLRKQHPALIFSKDGRTDDSLLKL